MVSQACDGTRFGQQEYDDSGCFLSVSQVQQAFHCERIGWTPRPIEHVLLVDEVDGVTGRGQSPPEPPLHGADRRS